jgi:DNA-binding MarR family transcriptional regulator
MSKSFSDEQIAALRELWAAVMPSPAPVGHAHVATAASALHALVVRSLLQLSAEIEKRMDVFVRPFDLSVSRMGVLLVLFFTPERPTPSQIGERLYVTRGNMTGLIEGLVGDGLVRRVERAGDRRAHELELTQAGRALVKEYFPQHQRVLESLLAGLDDDECLALASLLQKVRAGLPTPESLQRPS